MILEAFGEYWPRHTDAEGYGGILSMMGTTFEEFLDNLDDMHERVQTTMPELTPPSFEREVQADGTMILHYRSERPGLAPMVIGILKGLASRFETEVVVEQLSSPEPGHDRFLLTTTSA